MWDVANESDLEKSSIWFGGKLPETFYTYGTPSQEAAPKGRGAGSL